jgi:hypothetical protein
MIQNHDIGFDFGEPGPFPYRPASLGASMSKLYPAIERNMGGSPYPPGIAEKTNMDRSHKHLFVFAMTVQPNSREPKHRRSSHSGCEVSRLRPSILSEILRIWS